MVLPLYVSLDKFDFSLLDAGRDLGASGWNNFWRILIPLTKPGIVTGSILVFTPALGEFLIPDLLGGAKTMLMGNLITDQFLKMRDWPFGSSLSVALMALVFASLVVILRLWMKEESQKPDSKFLQQREAA
jgi:spermidine/putrescine transport system permease protein